MMPVERELLKKNRRKIAKFSDFGIEMAVILFVLYIKKTLMSAAFVYTFL